jgi:hypothetical protein
MVISFAALGASAADKEIPKRHFVAKTPAEADAWQRESRSLLFNLLKMDDLVAARATMALNPKTISTDERDKYTYREIEINSTPARRIKCIVTVPKGATTKSPAVVCIHGHGGSRTIVYDRKSVYNGFAADLAERGFVTISTDVGQHNVYEPKRTLMGERLWDVMRCVDMLVSMPEVDVNRMGCAGLSLGGEMAMWLGAMEPRMKATVSSGFLTTMQNMRVGHCMCWDFPGLGENFEFSDIYSLTAPRALMCQNGQKEPARGGFPVALAEQEMTEIERAYSVFNRTSAAKLNVHADGHVFIVSPAVDFLNKHLTEN